MTGLVSVHEEPGRPSATPGGGPRLTSVDVVGMPWAFTQYEPLSTSEFISQAERRGFHLDSGRLRQLYRRGVLVPLAYVTSRQVGPERRQVDPNHAAGAPRCNSCAMPATVAGSWTSACSRSVRGCGSSGQTA
jgi:hypothetical protein